MLFFERERERALDTVVSLGLIDIADFVKAPSMEFLDRCSKEQLLKLEHYDAEISDKLLKNTVKEKVETFPTTTTKKEL